ncbi:MAG TPA: MgtC/SapB family protein [Gemmatimonadales bacterium]|nr:MgtC/SapB family protein [Gemmatimonadales bacterium]
MPFPWDLVGRIALAAVLGAVIGYERDRHGRPAGLRTHMVVALASATFMAVSVRFIQYQHYAAADRVEVDVSRIAAAIVTGIGFLGGGAIIRSGGNIQGLTTAAGLWLVGAIGMAAGGGMFAVAGFATLVGLLVLGLLRAFEDKPTQNVWRVTVEGRNAPQERWAAALEALGAQTSLLRVVHGHVDGGCQVVLEARLPSGVQARRVSDTLAADPEVQRVTIEAAT